MSRARYVLTKRYFRGGWRARLRAFWHYVVRRYPYEICGDCGRPVGLVWTAPDPVWLKVNGGDAGIMCLSCFDAACVARGLFLRWEPRPL